MPVKHLTCNGIAFYYCYTLTDYQHSYATISLPSQRYMGSIRMRNDEIAHHSGRHSYMREDALHALQ